jgi:hypothetical protein
VKALENKLSVLELSRNLVIDSFEANKEANRVTLVAMELDAQTASSANHADIARLQGLLKDSNLEREKVSECLKEGEKKLVELNERINILDAEKDMVSKLLEGSDLEREKIMLLSDNTNVALSENQIELEGVKMRGNEYKKLLHDRIKALNSDKEMASKLLEVSNIERERLMICQKKGEEDILELHDKISILEGQKEVVTKLLKASNLTREEMSRKGEENLLELHDRVRVLDGEKEVVESLLQASELERERVQTKGEQDSLQLNDRIRIVDGEKKVVSKLLEASHLEREKVLSLIKSKEAALIESHNTLESVKMRGEEDLRSLQDKIRVLDDDKEAEKLRELSVLEDKEKALHDSQTTLKDVKLKKKEDMKALHDKFRVLDGEKELVGKLLVASDLERERILLLSEIKDQALSESLITLEGVKIKGGEYKKLLHDRIRALKNEKEIVSKEYESSLIQLQGQLDVSEMERNKVLVLSDIKDVALSESRTSLEELKKSGEENLLELNDKIRILDCEKEVVRKLLEASDLERERVLLLAESKGVALSDSQTKLEGLKTLGEENMRVVSWAYEANLVHLHGLLDASDLDKVRVLSEFQNTLEDVKLKGVEDMRALQNIIEVLDNDREMARKENEDDLALLQSSLDASEMERGRVLLLCERTEAALLISQRRGEENLLELQDRIRQLDDEKEIVSKKYEETFADLQGLINFSELERIKMSVMSERTEAAQLVSQRRVEEELQSKIEEHESGLVEFKKVLDASEFERMRVSVMAERTEAVLLDSQRKGAQEVIDLQDRIMVLDEEREVANKDFEAALLASQSKGELKVAELQDRIKALDYQKEVVSEVYEADLMQLQGLLNASDCATLVSQRRGEIEVLELQDKIRMLDDDKVVVSKAYETNCSQLQDLIDISEAALIASQSQGEHHVIVLQDTIKVLNDDKEVVDKQHEVSLLELQTLLNDSELDRERMLLLSESSDQALTESQTALKGIQMKGDEYKRLMHDKIRALNSEKEVASKGHEASLLEVQGLLKISKTNQLVDQRRGEEEVLELQDQIRTLDDDKKIVRRYLRFPKP